MSLWTDSNTHRLANPHIRIEELTVEQFTRAFGLTRTELVFEAAVRFAELIGGTVLATRVVIVHIDFIDNESLQQTRDRFVRFAFDVMSRIASPHRPIGTFHHLLQHLLRLLCALIETLAQQMRFACEISYKKDIEFRLIVTSSAHDFYHSPIPFVRKIIHENCIIA